MSTDPDLRAPPRLLQREDRRPLAPFVFLEMKVLSDAEIKQEEDGWGIVKIDRREAYGCGADGVLMAEGLTLSACVVDKPIHPYQCFLSIHANSHVFSSLKNKVLAQQEADFPGRTHPEIHGQFDYPWFDRVVSHVEAVDKNILVLTASFRGFCESSDYYLVYDAQEASLAMIPHLPQRTCRLQLNQRPLVVRCGDKCALLLVAKNLEWDKNVDKFTERDVLCMWPPPPSSRPPPPPPPPVFKLPYSYQPWHFKEPHFPNKMPADFLPHVAFSSKDHVFWADLTKGVLCCSSSDLLVGGCQVFFRFIHLPKRCSTTQLDDSNTGPADMFRTMGCTGDSVKFVAITFNRSVAPGDRTVTEWTLNTSTWQWTEGQVLRVSTMWEQEDFKTGMLPQTVPWYPMLSPQQDDDANIYFVLSKKRRAKVDPGVHTMCAFNMRSQSLVLTTPLPCPSFMLIPPTTLGCEFFKYLHGNNIVPVTFCHGS